ncbi:MAG: hypothetical protein N2439_05695 [Anaerolineae bacterium]|nr:hypothetical protein [Anaerolineae bacterium]
MDTLSAYLDSTPHGRVFSDLAAARAAGPVAGDTILLRDLAALVPTSTWTCTPQRGRWWARPYVLADGQAGRLLMVNASAGADGLAAIPPELTISLDLPGWYAIWIGVPRLDLRPVLTQALDGVDVALDGDPAFVHVFPERGTRHGRPLGPMPAEVMCYWTCAPLDRRTLRLRVPYGTFCAHPWGLVRASLSALRLVRLSEAQIAAYQRDATDPTHKRVLIFHDGYSPYFQAGIPGGDIDARFPQTFRGSDVRAIILQAPATGVANWPSRVTELVGAGVRADRWPLLRRGDRRACDYLHWACANGREGMRVMADGCHAAGMEFHAGLRMNLFFTNGPLGQAVEEFFNGPRWREHPEWRKPGSAQWDYAQAGPRRYVVDLLTELAANYDLDGINLDFTRWPPVADPERHDNPVLTGFVKEIRLALERVARARRRPLALSASVVDGYHAFTDLAGQRIDLATWLADGLLDFVCVQAWDIVPYVALARRHGVPIYAIMDQESVDEPRGKRFDPAWQQPTRRDEDPLPGEELEEAPHVNSTLDPTEYDRGARRYYCAGADGIALVNAYGAYGRRLGHIEEIARRTTEGRIFGQPADQVWAIHITA